MPNIRQYENPINGLQPSDKGIEARELEGRHIEASFSQIAQDTRQLGGEVDAAGQRYENEVTMREHLTGVANVTRTYGALEQSWRQAIAADAAAPTHDAHLFDTWREKTLGPMLDSMDSGFSTEQSKAWWQEKKADLTQHFMERGLADMGSLAGMQAIQDLKTTANAAESAAYNDPSSANLQRGLVGDSVDALKSGLGSNATPEAIERLDADHAVTKGSITLAQARGLIDQSDPNDPDGPLKAAKLFHSLPEAQLYLDTEQRDSVDRYAQTVKEQRIRDANVANENQRRQTEDKVNTALSQLYASGVQPDGSWLPPQNANKIAMSLASLGAKPEAIKSFTEMIKTATEDSASGRLVTSNPSVFSDFIGRTAIAPGQPGALEPAEIWRAVAQRQISNHDGEVLSKALDSSKTPGMAQLQAQVNSFVDAYKLQLGASGSTATADGIKSFYAYKVAVQNAVNWYVGQGHSPAEAQQALLDPHSQYFIGHYLDHWKVIAPTKAGLSAGQAPMAPSANASTQPKWDGKEDLDAYLKRVGK
jgi:hypothetical protein